MTVDIGSLFDASQANGAARGDDCVARVVRLARRLLGVPHAAVALVEPECRLLRDCDRLPDRCTDDAGPVHQQWFHDLILAGDRPVLIADVRPSPHAAEVEANAASVAFVGVPIRTAEGRTVGTLIATDAAPRAWGGDQASLLADVASFVAAEIELRREAEARRTGDIRQLADAMPQIVWTAKPDGCLDYCNQRWFDYTGMSFEQTRDCGWKPVVHPDDLDDCIARWTRAITTGTTHEEEIRMRRASDGAYRWHLSRALPVRDGTGRILHWVGTSTDIHDRKMLADQLEARVGERTRQLDGEKQFVAAVLDHITDGIVACDTAGRVTYMNGAIREMQGLPGDAATGPLAAELKLYDCRTGDLLPWDRRPLGMALRRQPMDAVECCVHRPDGHVRDVVASARPMTDAAGEVVGAVAVWHDVTELRRSRRELVKARDAAEAGSRSKGEFLANMSHEIRTPMTAIIGYAGLLSDCDHSPADRAEYVQIIRRNGDHLLCIVNDILDLSKIEAGKMRAEPMAMSPRRLVAEVESSMRVRAAERNIAFDVECGDDVPEAIWSDPTRLRQVLLNLVSNAIKFTSDGGVRLVLAGDAATGTLTIAVTDTGIGMTPDQLGHLFEPFSQADASTTRRFGGTGLGLAVSKRLVEMLGGALTAVSEVGVGSTFTCTIACGDLPAEATAPVPATPTTATPAQGVRGRVLLVEDSADNRRLVRVYLEEAGLTVDVAEDGQAAVDAVTAADLHGEPFDLVLMDMQMPVMDGYAATREIRARGMDELPIIAFTAHAMATEADRCAAAGCDGYATKPVDPVALVDTIARHLRGGRPIVPRSSPLPTRVADPPGGEAIRSEMEGVYPICRIIPEYVSGLPAHVASLTEAVRRSDDEAVWRLAHQIRGSAGSYGFPALTDMAGAAETAVREHGIDQSAETVETLIRSLRLVAGYDRSLERKAA